MDMRTRSPPNRLSIFILNSALSELTELPLRSVQRYIAALQATGEWIEYDRALRGWKLFHGISILYGDV